MYAKRKQIQVNEMSLWPHVWVGIKVARLYFYDPISLCVEISPETVKILLIWNKKNESEFNVWMQKVIQFPVPAI